MNSRLFHILDILKVYVVFAIPDNIYNNLPLEETVLSGLSTCLALFSGVTVLLEILKH